MQRLFIIILIIVGIHPAVAQTFTTNVNANISPFGFGYLNNPINVPNLGVLDGINLGIDTVSITLTSQGSPEIYLVAPDGHAVYILSGSTPFNITNGKYKFTTNPTDSSIKYKLVTKSLPGTYTPYGNLNAFNAGQNASGQQPTSGINNWRLFGTTGGTASVSSWSITFGKNNIVPAASNQSAAKATPLINTSLTGNFITGDNMYHGIVISDSKGTDVGSRGGYTETSIWYSFVPQCSDDKIELSYRDGHVQTGILTKRRGNPLTTFRSQGQVPIGTHIYNVTYIPDSTYYLTLDGSEADIFQYDIKWTKGNSNCKIAPTITTTAQGQPEYCPENQVLINFSLTGAFQSGNRFTAQLSDENGSFNNPQTLGFKDALTSSAILGVLPGNLIPGRSYKIRVIANNPATIGTPNSGITIKSQPSPVTNITGFASVCSGDADLEYSVNQAAGASKYQWNTTAGSNITSSNADSSVVKITASNSDFQISVSSKNECGKSSPFQKSISIISPLRPSVIISFDEDTICQGQSVLFSSKPIDEGLKPTYTWLLNNTRFGDNTPSLSVTNLESTDMISLELSVEEKCTTSPSSFSNKLSVLVRDTINPTVVITGDKTICLGNSVNYIATIKNGGPAPIFKWYINDKVQEEETDSSLTTIYLKDKDTVYVVATSNAKCVKPITVTSNKIGISVTNTVVPTVSIAAPAFTCQGEKVTIEAQSTNEGQNPSFEWYLNGDKEGDDSKTFVFDKFKDGDSLQAILFSDLSCAVPYNAFSEKIKIIVLDTVKPVLALSGDTLVCLGANAIIKSTFQNSGPDPEYTWDENGAGLSSKDEFNETLPFGPHTLTFTAQSNERCALPVSVSKSFKLTVLDTSSIKPLIAGDSMICEGNLANYWIRNFDVLKSEKVSWLINNSEISKTDSSFSSNFMAVQDVVSLKVESQRKCVTFKSSNLLLVTVTKVTKDSISITASKKEGCLSDKVTYKVLDPLNELNPKYYWTINNKVYNTDIESLESEINPDNTILFHNVSLAKCIQVYKAPDINIANAPKDLTSIMGNDDYCAQDQGISFITDDLPDVTYIWSYPSYAKAGIDRNKINLDLQGNTSTDTLKVKTQGPCGIGNEVIKILKPKNCTDLMIPSAIIGSAENGNNLWVIQGIEAYQNASVSVFNRWGNKVFLSKNYSKPWDGMVNGKMLPAGTYYYLIEGVNEKGITGPLTIIN